MLLNFLKITYSIKKLLVMFFGETVRVRLVVILKNVFNIFNT